ncbi:sensor histidine kinase N-terminal domain-containing protein [Achromobacter xylosoxidans]
MFALGVALLACALIGLFFFLRGYAQRAAEQAFDRLLAASALTIAGSVQIEDDGVTVEPPVSSLAMLSGSERVFYEALASNAAPADHRLRRPGARPAAGAIGHAGLRLSELSR